MSGLRQASTAMKQVGLGPARDLLPKAIEPPCHDFEGLQVSWIWCVQVQKSTKQSFSRWYPGRLVIEDLLEASGGQAQANRVAINFHDARSTSIAFGDLDTRSIGDARGERSGRPGAVLVATCQQTQRTALMQPFCTTQTFSQQQTSQASRLFLR